MISVIARRGGIRIDKLARTGVTNLLTIMKSTSHRFVANDTAGHFTLVARDVKHDSVATSARSLHWDDAGRTRTFMARVGLGRVTTIAALGAWMRADESRRTADDGRFLNRLTAGADNIVENGFEASIALTLVTRLLACVFTAA